MMAVWAHTVWPPRGQDTTSRWHNDVRIFIDGRDFEALVDLDKLLKPPVDASVTDRAVY